VKEKIYGEEMNNLSYFIFISKVLENIDQVELGF
jgi:hypothetical protein